MQVVASKASRQQMVRVQKPLMLCATVLAVFEVCAPLWTMHWLQALPSLQWTDIVLPMASSTCDVNHQAFLGKSSTQSRVLNQRPMEVHAVMLAR